jgi:hypothetical protein
MLLRATRPALVLLAVAGLGCGATTVSGTYHATDTSPIGQAIELSKDGTCKVSREGAAVPSCAYSLNGTQITFRLANPPDGLEPEYRGVLSMNRKVLMVEKVTWESAE